MVHLADLTKWLREALLARRHGPVAVLVTSATKGAVSAVWWLRISVKMDICYP